MKNLIPTLLLTATPLFAGVESPMVAPPPAPDCQAGWTFGLEALYLRAYQSEGDYDTGDYDWGGRASIGYDFNDCLFVKATYFGGYSSTVFEDTSGSEGDLTEESADLDVSYFNLVVGQHFKPSEKLSLSPYVGLVWANFDESYERRESDDGDVFAAENFETDFDGYGIVVGIDAVRELGGGFSLYGTAKQSVLFGESDITDEGFDQGGGGDDNHTEDQTLFISELGLGLQYGFNAGAVTGNIRLGVEGQWWAGLSGDNTNNSGLAGFVLGANIKL